MRYKLADRVQLVEVEGRVFLTDDEILELEGCSASQFQVLKLLKDGCNKEDIEAVLGHEGWLEMSSLLRELDVLRENWSNNHLGDIVEKQIYYFDDFSDQPNQLQKNVQQVSVAIVGVGGVGSVVLQHLVGAGIKSFHLIDHDRVQRDNQNRQFLYANTAIGQPKVEAAKAYLLQIDSSIQVTTYQHMVETEENLSVLDGQPVDLLINAADQPKDLYKVINQYCTKRRIPWIGAGVGRHSGYWGPLVIPGQTLCMECFCKQEDERMDPLEYKIRNHLPNKIQASFGATNTVISALLAKDVILYLALQDKSLVPSAGARCTMDFKTLNIVCDEVDTPHEACSCWKGEAPCSITP